MKTFMLAVVTLAGVAGIYPLELRLIAEQQFVVAFILVVIAGAIPGALTAITKPWEWGTKTGSEK